MGYRKEEQCIVRRLGVAGSVVPKYCWAVDGKSHAGVGRRRLFDVAGGFEAALREVDQSNVDGGRTAFENELACWQRESLSVQAAKSNQIDVQNVDN